MKNKRWKREEVLVEVIAWIIVFGVIVVVVKLWN
jgi:hypothetical protein